MSLDGGTTFAGVPFLTVAFESQTTATTTGAPGSPADSNDTHGTPQVAGKDAVASNLGSYAALGENNFVIQPDGTHDGGRSDINMPNTFITAGDATGGSNANVISQTDVQGPPVPADGSGSVAIGKMLWNFSKAGNAADGTTVPPTPFRPALAAGDIVRVRGDVIFELAAKIIAPFDDPLDAEGNVGGEDNAQSSVLWTLLISSTLFSLSDFTATQTSCATGLGGVANECVVGSTTAGIVIDHALTPGDVAQGLIAFNINFKTDATADSNTVLVPEPGSLALMGMGLLALSAVSRRRSKLKFS